jgi:hypothetical protein
MTGSGSTRSPLLAAVATVGGVLVVVLLVAWAALAGPEAAFEGHGPVAPTETTEPPVEERTAPEADPRRQAEDLAEDPGVRAVVAVVAAAVQAVALLGILGLLWLVARWLRTRWQLRVRRGRAPAARDFEVLTEHERLEEAMREDAAVQQRLLEEGTPGDAIVACWCRFEEQAGSAGLVRDPWETSAEFTLRALDLAAVDGHAVVRLSELYREARFSSHHLGEDARREARDALTRIHGSLGAVR